MRMQIWGYNIILTQKFDIHNVFSFAYSCLPWYRLLDVIAVICWSHGSERPSNSSVAGHPLWWPCIKCLMVWFKFCYDGDSLGWLNLEPWEEEEENGPDKKKILIHVERMFIWTNIWSSTEYLVFSTSVMMVLVMVVVMVIVVWLVCNIGLHWWTQHWLKCFQKVHENQINHSKYCHRMVREHRFWPEKSKHENYEVS